MKSITANIIVCVMWVLLVAFGGHHGGPIGYVHGFCETMIIRADMAINPESWTMGQSEDYNN